MRGIQGHLRLLAGQAGGGADASSSVRSWVSSMTVRPISAYTAGLAERSHSAYARPIANAPTIMYGATLNTSDFAARPAANSRLSHSSHTTYSMATPPISGQIRVVITLPR